LTVTIIPQSTKPIRAFGAVKSDRRKQGGGYRGDVQVLSSADLRAELMQEALSFLRYFDEKYKMLKELQVVFTAHQRAYRRHGKTVAAFAAV